MSAMKRHYEKICSNAWRIYRRSGRIKARDYLTNKGLSTAQIEELFEEFLERV